MELRARFDFINSIFPTFVNKVKLAWARFGEDDGGGGRIEFHISNLWQLPHDILFY